MRIARRGATRAEVIAVMAGRHKSGALWRTNRARLMSQARGCWICRAFGRDDRIDYALPANDPLSFEADHIIPHSRGGSDDLDNLDATHRRCNQWRRDRSVQEVLAIARRERSSRGGDERMELRPTTDW